MYGKLGNEKLFLIQLEHNNFIDIYTCKDKSSLANIFGSPTLIGSLDLKMHNKSGKHEYLD